MYKSRGCCCTNKQSEKYRYFTDWKMNNTKLMNSQKSDKKTFVIFPEKQQYGQSVIKITMAALIYRLSQLNCAVKYRIHINHVVVGTFVIKHKLLLRS